MKKSFHRKLIAGALLSTLAVTTVIPSFAQSGSSSSASASSSGAGGGSQTPSSQQTSRHDMRASQLIGKDVVDRQGKKLGKVEDLFLNPGVQQRAPFAVLSFDESLGLEDKLFAIPLTALDLSRGRADMVLTLQREKLKNAPGFARDAWPHTADNRYFEEVTRFFGRASGQSNPNNHGMMRASELLGRDVNDGDGNDAGEVQDVVVDISRGGISYVVLDFDKTWSLSDKLIPLPLTAFRFPMERGADLVLNLDREKLSQAKGFERSHWPDLNSPAFRQHTDAYFLALQRPAPQQNDRGGLLESYGPSK